MKKTNGLVLRILLLLKDIVVPFYCSPETPPILIGDCKAVDIKAQTPLMFLLSLLSMEYRNQFLSITYLSEQ